MSHLDSDLLRTFLAISDAGSFVGGAARIYRSQSAASTQIAKLEALLGADVFERHGRGVRLTATGEKLEPVARGVVRQLDETLADLTGSVLTGKLRVGIPDDDREGRLSRVVADFARTYPGVELSVHCSFSAVFPKALAEGQLDLAVHEVGSVGPGMEQLWAEPIGWAASRAHSVQQDDPLPVALFDRACWWRDVAISSLRDSGRRYRIVYSSETAVGVAAAIRAGIAVGVLNRSAIHDDLVMLSPADGFSDLPPSYLVIERGEGGNPELCAAMSDSLRRAFSRA
ncbi:LysR substrate-binding domain-containing protein [Nisaea denitrificans]|uniref:LysR substrate-binding domain-containing protein n=1 Tax=Nisaea denitrificans TaxID=390877 RepID=UPI00040892FB|nr:LysR substrate-binding domain-containing protein [Nisaea denitrificans]